MGNKNGRKTKPVDSMGNIFVMGDPSMAQALFSALDKLFVLDQFFIQRQPVVSSGPTKVRYRDGTTLWTVAVIEDCSKLATHIPIVWLVDWTFKEKQRQEILHECSDIDCLPSTLWELVISYHDFYYSARDDFSKVGERSFLNQTPVVRLVAGEVVTLQDLVGFKEDAPQWGMSVDNFLIHFECLDELAAIWRRVQTLSSCTLSYMADIGEFGVHENSPGINILLALDCHHTSKTQIQEIIQAVAVQKCRQPVWDANYALFHSMLDPIQCESVIQYIDQKAHADALFGRPQRDFKINVSVDTLSALIGKQSYNALALLFGRIDEIKLRRAEGNRDDPRCINFHVDFNSRTMQVALNGDDTYEGGRLVYLVQSEVHTPSRRAGTCTIHDDRLVHGVSPLLDGARYGLFFLQTCP